MSDEGTGKGTKNVTEEVTEAVTEEATEVKDKFRAALERKRNHQADRAADASDRDGSKIHGEHGAVGGKRTFRRKSGG